MRYVHKWELIPSWAAYGDRARVRTFTHFAECAFAVHILIRV